MTVIAEMGAAPTEPQPDIAAKLALEGQKLFTMLSAILCFDWTALRAHQFRSIEVSTCTIGFLTHHFSTALPATEIRFFALETLEVRIDSHRVLTRLIVKVRFRVSQLRVFLQLLELQSTFCFLLQAFVQLLIFIDEQGKGTVFRQSDPLLAQGAVAEPEQYSGGQPPNLQSFLQAGVMENVAATAHDAWTCLQILNVAYAAVGVLILIMLQHFLGAFLGQTGQALGLFYVAIAGVLAGVNFGAGFGCYFLALLSFADVIESLQSQIASISSLQYVFAITAFLRVFKLFVFTACPPQVVRSSVANFALFLLASFIRAYEPILSVVDGMKFHYFFAGLVGFGSIFEIALSKLVLMLTLAAASELHGAPKNFCLELVELLPAEYLPDLIRGEL